MNTGEQQRQAITGAIHEIRNLYEDAITLPDFCSDLMVNAILKRISELKPSESIFEPSKRQRVIKIIGSYGMYGKAIEMADEIIKEFYNSMERKPSEDFPSIRGFLHSHPFTEKMLGVDENHIIVDKKDWEIAKNFPTNEGNTELLKALKSITLSVKAHPAYVFGVEGDEWHDIIGGCEEAIENAEKP